MSLKNQGWIIACCLYFLLLLIIMLLADFGQLRGLLFTLSQPPSDKFGHFILYGIGSFLIHRAMNKRLIVIFHQNLPLGPFIFTLITAFEEMLQSILPHRSASMEDFIASFLGIIIFYLVGEKIHR